MSFLTKKKPVPESLWYRYQIYMKIKCDYDNSFNVRWQHENNVKVVDIIEFGLPPLICSYECHLQKFRMSS